MDDDRLDRRRARRLRSTSSTSRRPVASKKCPRFSVAPLPGRATLTDVRGDSRRDLYSKTLALCGLGVLAGAGALVDYWPVGIRFPAAAPVVQDPLTRAAPLPVPVPFPLPLPNTVAAVDQPLIERAALRPDSATWPLEPLPVTTARLDIGTSAGIHAMLPPPALVHVRHEVPLFDGPTVMLDAPAPVQVADHAILADDAESSGFISTAFRWTGSSIVRTGAKTGASLADAVRVVGSVVRRALPN